MSTALLDELLFWMRCRQPQREARTAAEQFIQVLEDSEQESRLCVLMSKYVRITQAQRRKINQKRWAREKCTTVDNKNGFPTSQIRQMVLAHAGC